MDVQDFFKKWTSTRPKLIVEFHKAGIEAMAFAQAYSDYVNSEINKDLIVQEQRTEVDWQPLRITLSMFSKEISYMQNHSQPVSTLKHLWNEISDFINEHDTIQCSQKLIK